MRLVPRLCFYLAALRKELKTCHRWTGPVLIMFCGCDQFTVYLQSLARANRQRLAVLLGEVQSGKHSEDRYEAALRGESLGTHSRGTTVGAQSIRNASESNQKQST